jgi:hypothetical protein
MKLYTISINLENREIEEDVAEVDEPYFDVDYMTEGDAVKDGQVMYNEDGWGNIYVEASSLELAKKNLREFALKMSDDFKKVAEAIL